MSFSVRSILSPMLLPLFKIERWVRQAALGAEVVPEVNWILIMSLLSSGCLGSGFGNEPSERT